jgi:CRISPR/Cas system CSM-associated protein Csm3 (group 7 of RAMP superfamily)
MKRYIYEGKLILCQCLHIGSGEYTFRTDAAVVRRRDGSFYIPGTTLGGVFRSAVESLATYIEGLSTCAFKKNCFEQKKKPGEECSTCSLFGFGANASKITFEDSAILQGITGIEEVRDGVGIHRKTEASREKVKFDYEIIPVGSQFRFEILIENPTSQDKWLVALGLNGFSSGFCSLGGKTTSGLGNFKLVLDDAYEIDLANPETLVQLLKTNKPDSAWKRPPQDLINDWLKDLNIDEDKIKTAQEQWKIPNFCSIKLKLSIANALLVKSGDPSLSGPEEYSARFVTTTRIKDDGSCEEVQFLPGSLLKGIFRSRCEKIIRTLGVRACDPQEDSDGEVITCANQFKDLEKKGVPLPPPEEIYNECSCLVCKLFGSSYMKGRIKVMEAYPLAQIQLKKVDNVAIDRFTGGAVEGKKFNAQIAVSGNFDCEFQLNNFEFWQLGLLAYLFKDLYLEDLHIGYGRYKGYGKVKGVIEEITVHCFPETAIYKLLSDNGFSGIENQPRVKFEFKDFLDGNGEYKRDEKLMETVEKLAEKFKNVVEASKNG